MRNILTALKKKRAFYYFYKKKKTQRNIIYDMHTILNKKKKRLKYCKIITLLGFNFARHSSIIQFIYFYSISFERVTSNGMRN